MDDPRSAGLPGYPPGEIARHAPRWRWTFRFLSRAYVRRWKVAAFLLPAAAAAAAWQSVPLDGVGLPAPGVEYAAPESLPEKASRPTQARRAAPRKEAEQVMPLAAPEADGQEGGGSFLPVPGMTVPEGGPAAGRDGGGREVRLVMPGAEAFRRAEEAVAAAEAGLDAMLGSLGPFELNIDPVETGFWRGDEGGEEQYFIVVEASRGGEPVEWEATDMDSGERAVSSRWAVHVTPEEFARVAAEKAVHGRVAGALAGRRAAGSAEIEWLVDTDGQLLAEWEEGE